MVVSCTRWLSLRLDLLSSLFVTIVAVAAILITEDTGECVLTHADYACFIKCFLSFIATTLNFNTLRTIAILILILGDKDND